jgi:hypothetical protein
MRRPITEAQRRLRRYTGNLELDARERHFQFSAAMKRLGIETILACPRSGDVRHASRPAANGWASAEIAGRAEANRCLRQTRLPEFNAQFTVPTREEDPAFIARTTV